jgi:MoaA/NifB/PqqE/SkfB family radical SAM enzyme
MESARQTEPPGSGTLMLHLLGKCNLTCVHCYMDGAPTRRERLALEGVLDAIEDCPTLGVGTLYLTGGEPLMYRDLFAVLEAAAAVPGLETTLCTNATLLTTSHVARIAALGIGLNVSVDGESEYHDAFRRQRGAFAKTECGIRLAVESGVPVTVVTTVSRNNLAGVAALADWAAERGVSTIRFQPLLKLGRGASIADERLSSAETAVLVMQVSDLANRHRGRLKCNIVGQSRRFMLAHPCAAYVCNGTGCHRRISREIKKIVVRENGTVLPEATNLSPRFAIGHIADDRLTTLVSRFLDKDYGRFDALCRRTYAAVLPHWEAPVVPWDQILAESSHNCDADALMSPAADPTCASGCQALSGQLVVH